MRLVNSDRFVVNRESSEWADSAAVSMNEKHDSKLLTTGQYNRSDAAGSTVSRKRRWSAPHDCCSSATPTTTTHHLGNVSSTSNKTHATV